MAPPIPLHPEPGNTIQVQSFEQNAQIQNMSQQKSQSINNIKSQSEI